MSEIKGECVFSFSFPDDYRFKGMSHKQKESYMRKAFMGILRAANLTIQKAKVILE